MEVGASVTITNPDGTIWAIFTLGLNDQLMAVWKDAEDEIVATNRFDFIQFLSVEMDRAAQFYRQFQETWQKEQRR